MIEANDNQPSWEKDCEWIVSLYRSSRTPLFYDSSCTRTSAHLSKQKNGNPIFAMHVE